MDYRMSKIPVHVWRLDGRTITLIGAVHIGEPEYYREMRALIDEVEATGAVVHVEGTRNIDDPSATDQERDWIKRLAVEDGSYENIAQAFGLVTQKALGYPDHWQNHDLTLLEMLRHLPDPEEFVSDFVTMNAAVGELKDVPVVRRFLKWVITSGVLRQLRMVVGVGDMKHAHALRDRKAVGAMIGASGDVVAVWGMAHLRSMGKLLRRSGWRRVR